MSTGAATAAIDHEAITHAIARPRAMRQVVSQDDYRDMMSSFPTGVAVVTTVDADHRPRGMTCSSLTSVTLEPPTVLVCLRNGSATLEGVASSNRFAINLLHADSDRIARLFSSPVPDRFSYTRWERSALGLPWLVDAAFAFADCEVTGSTIVGDHTVVFGEVIMLRVEPNTPLLYGRRQFTPWAGASDTAARREA
jgi:flavin reductase (NADH)